jgi:prephenate dehydrogenase
VTDTLSFFSGKITIFGVGLLGGSFALALRAHGATCRITGCGRNETRLRQACELGIIDTFTTDAAAACDGADLILLATPVETFRDIAAGIRPYLKPGVIVTDVGSVKSTLVSDLETLMPPHARFVGSHPIAGGDASGFEAARADLFDGERCILTPTDKTDPIALQAVHGLWQSLGMRVEQMPAARHDALYAQVSHFPHLLAYALVNSVTAADATALGYAGSGFRDTTRIAQSSAGLWSGILMANREQVLTAAEAFRTEYDHIITALEQKDTTALKALLSRARAARTSVPAGKRTGE